MPSDQALVRAILLGSQTAAEALLVRHLDVLRRDARRHDWQLPDGTDVEDALQEFLLKVCANDFRALAQWQGLTDPAEPSIAPYFRSILRNLLNDLGRRKQGELADEPWEDDEATGLQAEGDGANPAEALERAQLREAVAACMATALKLTQRKVIALHLEDRPHQEIAATLGLSVANSRVILNRALQALAACLKARLRNAAAARAVLQTDGPTDSRADSRTDWK